MTDQTALIQSLEALLKNQQWQEASAFAHQHFNDIQMVPQTHYAVGVHALNTGQNAQALTCFTNALKLNHDYAEAAYQLGLTHLALMDMHSAVNAFNHVIKLQPDNEQAMEKLGDALRDSNRGTLALQCFESLKKRNPNYPMIDNKLAILHEALGNDEQADAYYESCLEQYPDNAHILFNNVQRNTPTPKSDIAKKLHAIIERYELTANTKDHSYIYACYGLARIHDKAKDLENAYTYYEKANLAHHKIMPFNSDHIGVWLEQCKKSFTPKWVAKTQPLGNPDATPIFVLGLPRSGTSLTTQILGSHANVTAAGELEILRRMVSIEIPKITQEAFPNGLDKIPNELFAQMGHYYVNTLKTYAHDDSPAHIVDKMPSNMLYIGLIKAILPNAKIIHCKRDPIDNCWSIWRQAYVGVHHYKNTFEQLGAFYQDKIALMEYWKSLYPDSIYEFSYEVLVENPETSIRSLLDYCNLEWDENCLNFHETKNFVYTASVNQINKPLYKSAVKSWAAIEDKLEPLKRALSMS
ncbi:MAG: sulfotransferase [Rickettsiales bacterium]|nr:sulfotransferase [Rickettsiales bacterium]